MSSVQIAIINASTVLSDTQVADVVPALQQQVSKDYAPAWGTDATLIFVPKGQNPPVGAWWIAILDNSDTAGVLGFHDCSVEGLPLGKVFAGTDLQYGASWTVTASHELLEMLADPDVNLSVMVDGKAHRHHVWAFENCDPCLTGDTRIPLLDGTSAPIESLVGREEFWVYSVDTQGAPHPGRGHSARLTKKNAPVLAVSLDNGEVVRCTSDHRFMRRDGSYAQAKDLAVGDSLMPLYLKVEKRGGKGGYECIRNNATMKYEYTHRMVAGEAQDIAGKVVHHCDHTKRNNVPANLHVYSRRLKRT